MPTTTCKRHPREETGLACSNCGDPICHRCAVPSVVGQKCPDCARQKRSARARGKPRQYAKAAAFGVVVAACVAVALFFLFQTIGSWIASAFGGYGVARAVLTGAEGNAARPFQILAVVLAVLGVAGAWLAHGVFVPGGLGIVTYLAAAYGAWLVYR